MPAIASVGLSHRGIEHELLAVDFRYIDFENTDGYDESGFNLDGSLRGIGFEVVFAVSLGTQLTLTDRLSVRIGYSYNDTPIPSEQATANAASPVIVQHMLGCGLSYHLTPAFTLNAAYTHAFENDLKGPIILPSGTISGGSIQSTAEIEMVTLGATVKFGPRG